MNKKLFFLPILALMLFTFSACKPEKTEPAPPVPPVVKPEPPKDIYDRAGIIAGNKSLDTSNLDATSAWAIEWAKTQYTEADISSATAVENSACIALSSILHSDNIGLSSHTWNVTITLKDGTEDVIPVQTLYYIQDGFMYLSGILAKDDILKTQEAAYSYFKTDSRLTAQLKAYPSSEYSGNITEISFSELTGIVFDRMCLLGSDTLAAIKSSTSDNGTISCVVELMNTTNQNVFKTIEYSTTANKKIYLDGETLVLEYVDPLDGTSIVHHEITAGGTQNKMLTTDKLNEYTLPGGARIVEDACNLYWSNPATSEKKLLLEGVNAQDDSVQSYRMIFNVDDQRIAYVKMGWESILSCGVYDLEANADHAIIPPANVTELYPLKTVNGVLYCTGKIYNATAKTENFVLTATNLSTYVTELILPGATGYSAADISPDGKTAAYMSVVDNRANITVYTIATGAIVSQADIYSPFEQLFDLAFIGNETVQAWGFPHVYTSPLLYKLTLPKTASSVH